ncbi:hypothetical protein G6O69_11570 [Pseudenhygromyxa sp. WMMC2535]|uniref:hypothetical protein n=1 Tax=Pseudenhygromyxa sp. WMMC2535 TaxID=2712867 RepID=UPI001554101F|nr:hypothetical protein [Pseudenhygromyxa sp. WMMC2535]NVB38472.1 hypothetical protein [Pseudenhygromyxa sp. WMMC2535]
MPLQLLIALSLVAVLLGLAVGMMVREQLEDRRRARAEELSTLKGRVKAKVREGAGRMTKEASRASRKGAIWLLRRRLFGDGREGEGRESKGAGKTRERSKTGAPKDNPEG